MKTLLALCAAALTLTACASQPRGPSDNERRADALLMAGVDALERQEYTEALRSLQEALKYNPKSPLILTDLGVAYAGKNEPAKAEELWKKALQVTPSHQDARLNLGILYLNRKNYREAEKILKEASKEIAYQKLDQVFFQLAMLYFAVGKPLLAEQQLKIAVRENRGNCGAWMKLGLLQKERGDYVEAAQSLKGAVMGTCYKNPEAHYEIATLYLKAQDTQNAKTKLLEIIQLFPSSEWASRSEATLNMIR